MSPKKDDTQELLAFLMEKHGGEEEVRKEFYSGQIGDLAGDGFTIKELRAEAKEGGWQTMLDNMKVTELANIVNPPAMMGRAPSKPGKPTSGRLTKEQKAEVIEQSLEHLGENPWKSKIEIADAIDFESKKLGPILKQLRDDGKLQTEGEKAGMKYALTAEKSKPQ